MMPQGCEIIEPDMSPDIFIKYHDQEQIEPQG